MKLRALAVCFVLASAGACWAQTGEASTSDLAAAFAQRLRAADVNGDGKLSMNEMRAGFREGGNILYAYDKNNDGFLAGAEIEDAAWLEASLGAGKCDKDGDGVLKGAEMACYSAAK
jgi:hypothetical protein